MSCFNCPRTCRTHEAVDVCRFSELLAAIGVVGAVNSHTTTVDVKLRSPTALAAAVHQLGGTVLGQGEHAHYPGMPTVNGFGVMLPGWRYPVVLKSNGSLAFASDDAYRSSWQEGGDAVTIAKLTGCYVLAAAREAAGNLGWRVVESTPGSVTIQHSSGGRLTVNADGRCEAFGFTGTDCHATRPIEQALGEMKDRQFKPEYHTMRRMNVRQRGG